MTAFAAAIEMLFADPNIGVEAISHPMAARPFWCAPSPDVRMP